MTWIAGGRFLMGSDRHYPEERPAHPVAADGFFIDHTPVTNRDFARQTLDTASGHIGFRCVRRVALPTRSS